LRNRRTHAELNAGNFFGILGTGKEQFEKLLVLAARKMVRGILL
jgi:hypothetical protein